MSEEEEEFGTIQYNTCKKIVQLFKVIYFLKNQMFDRYNFIIIINEEHQKKINKLIKK